MGGRLGPGETRCRHGFPQASDDLKILAPLVSSSHGGQDRIGAALDRKVHMGTQALQFAVCRNEGGVKEKWMRARIADPFEARDGVQSGQQFAEGHGARLFGLSAAEIVTSVGVHRLSEQRDLPDPVCGEVFRFFQDGIGG